jgi:hypothetical protein
MTAGTRTKFYGTLEEVLQSISDAGLTVVEVQHCRGQGGQKQICLSNGTYVNWWENTGTLVIHGRPVPRDSVEQILFSKLRLVEENRSSKSEPDHSRISKPRQMYLRESRAARLYVCAQCSGRIPQGVRYFRDEPHPFARMQRGETVRYICASCVLGPNNEIQLPWAFSHIRRLPERNHLGNQVDDFQLVLPFGESGIIRPTRVRLLSVTDTLLPRIATAEELLALDSVALEELICDRVCAMGMDAQRVGHTYRADGGVDILFWPRAPFPVPFLGAVQVKHHRELQRKTGVGNVREMLHVLQSQPFHFGLIVTNTSFTANAEWVANNHRKLVRLRSLPDLLRWVRDDFTDEAEWREMPTELTLAPGLTIPLPPWSRAR